MAGAPGQLLSQEFVDFSTTRNWALRVRPYSEDHTHSSHCSIPSVIHRCISTMHDFPTVL